MYAGNVGFSQSLDLMLAAAREMPEVDVPRQRRRLGAAGARAGAPPGSPTSGSPATSRASACPRCSPPATCTSCRSSAASAASACRRRRTRSWPPAVRSSRRSTRTPRCRRILGRVRRRRGGRSGRSRGVRRAPCARLLADPDRGRGDGRRGRAWVEREASPAAVGVGVRPAHRLAGPLTPLQHEPPIASHARGTLLVIHQESRQARQVGPRQEGPLPGRHNVPH